MPSARATKRRVEPRKEKAMSDTIFSKIIRKEIPADIVFEDDQVIAFRDISPQAPRHVLFLPKKPFATLNDVPAEEAEMLGRLLLAAADYAKREGFADGGYRLVMNVNRDGGQTVFHLHLHLLAGRALHGHFG
jgi:histidine triad (HIT) family protein